MGAVQNVRRFTTYRHVRRSARLHNSGEWLFVIINYFQFLLITNASSHSARSVIISRLLSIPSSTWASVSQAGRLNWWSSPMIRNANFAVSIHVINRFIIFFPIFPHNLLSTWSRNGTHHTTALIIDEASATYRGAFRNSPPSNCSDLIT